jgi:hypothetical protein
MIVSIGILWLSPFRIESCRWRRLMLLKIHCMYPRAGMIRHTSLCLLVITENESGGTLKYKKCVRLSILTVKSNEICNFL